MNLSELTHIGDAPILGDHEPGSDEWHELRLAGIGGSEVAAVLGLSGLHGPHTIWMRKMGIPVDDDETIRMRVGSRLEPLVIELLAERSPHHAVPCARTLRHPDHDWWRLNTDGIVLADESIVAPVEAKTSSDRMYSHWMENGVPIYYQCQVQYALGATGMPYALVPCLFGNGKFEWWRVDRDEEDIAAIAEHVGAWWSGHVVTGEPPDIDGSSAARDYLVEKYGSSESDETVDLDESAETWVEQYYKARRLEKKAQALKSEAQNKLIEAVGDAKRGVTPSEYKITIVRARKFSEAAAEAEFGDELRPYRTKLDTSALRRERPKIYEAAKTNLSVYPRVSGGPDQ